MNKPIKSLYEHYKNTSKKLKIICDWDEVIQACEPYALWEAIEENSKNGWEEAKQANYPFRQDDYEAKEFTEFFKNFWEEEPPCVEYSLYGSKIKSSWKAEIGAWNTVKGRVGFRGFNVMKRYEEIKNSPNFYQEAPFLTIAEDLLKLIKEDKVDRLIFLSAYDKRKFPNGDPRKEQIFKETFDRVGYYRTELDKEKGRMTLPCYLELIGFDSKTQQGQSKAEKKLDELLKQNGEFKENDNLADKMLKAQSLISNKLNENDGRILKKTMNEVLEEGDPQSKNDWVRKNAWDYDIFIDDNPKICESMAKYGNGKTEYCHSCIIKEYHSRLKHQNPYGCDNCYRSKVLAPYYPTIKNQHHSEVLLVKQEVTKSIDFNKGNEVI